MGNVVTGAAGWLVALGIVTLALLPFAVPGIVLAVAALLPVLLLGAVASLVAALVALRRRAGARGPRIVSHVSKPPCRILARGGKSA